MIKKPLIAAAVLIGGHSSRMGCPKENMVLREDGRTFLNRLCDEVDSCLGQYLSGRYLSVRKGQAGLREGYITVEDKYDNIGPLGGLISTLEMAENDGFDAVLLLACDMVCYTGREISNICSLYDGQDILFARTEGNFLQPLASIYNVRISKKAVSLAMSGEYRLKKLADNFVKTGFYDSQFPEAYKNVNYPDDYK